MKVLIIGGNRFFGKRLALNLVENSHHVTLLNRGTFDDGLGNQVSRLRCDRSEFASMEKVLAEDSWDVVFDQVCFEPRDAINAVKLFKSKTAHYIFTSSQAVYSYGVGKRESDFDPFDLPTLSTTLNYADSKRQCEKIFAESDLPLSVVRLPVVLGPDDYTGRLEFHIKRINDGSPIYFPNISARYSFLSSEDAASGLSHLSNIGPQGAINISSPDSISLEAFLRKIQDVTRGRLVQASEADEQNKSPYGFTDDWTMSTSKMTKAGFVASSMSRWLMDLIDTVNEKSKEQL